MSRDTCELCPELRHLQAHSYVTLIRRASDQRKRRQAAHSDGLEVGDHLDPAPDHARVHGVVVAVEADVVITLQPQTRTATR